MVVVHPKLKILAISEENCEDLSETTDKNLNHTPSINTQAEEVAEIIHPPGEMLNLDSLVQSRRPHQNRQTFHLHIPSSMLNSHHRIEIN